eukprot:6398773-Amphidinium_carterae.1
MKARINYVPMSRCAAVGTGQRPMRLSPGRIDWHQKSMAGGLRHTYDIYVVTNNVGVRITFRRVAGRVVVVGRLV